MYKENGDGKGISHPAQPTPVSHCKIPWLEIRTGEDGRSEVALLGLVRRRIGITENGFYAEEQD